MAKNKPPKTPKSGKTSTSTLNQPLLPSSSATAASTASCSFSPAPDHGLFAHISNQVHQQRLKVYNASATAAEQTQLVTDYLLQQSSHTCLSSRWVRINTSSSASPSKSSAKKRKQSQDGSAPVDAAPPASSQLLLALGLSSGQVHLFSPSLAKAVVILDASSAAGSGTSAAANAGVVSLSHAEKEGVLYVCSKNGWVSTFSTQDLRTGADATPIKPVSSFRPDQKSAVHTISSFGNNLLAAHHSITLVDPTSPSGKAKATFTGHASPVTHLEWIGSDSFISAAEGDRVIYVWSYDASSTGKVAVGKPVATVALDAPVRCIAVSRQSPGPLASISSASSEERLLILVVTHSGSVRIYGLPDSSSSTPSGKKAKASVLPALELVSQVQGTTAETEWLDAKFVAAKSHSSGGVPDRLRLARLVRGAKVVIEDVSILDIETGHVRKTIEFAARSSGTKTVSASNGLLSADAEESQLTGGSSQTQRYVEPPARTSSAADVSTASLREAGLVGDDEVPVASSVGDEPTLAQRLNGLGFDAQDDDDEEGESALQRRAGGLVSEASLWSSLSQALHSGDNTLLTSCLNHNDAGLIRATVRGISGPLAVKLLEECVARLNGASGSNASKGTLGSQRARSLIEWIRATLLIHMGYLMSLPHLVSRMSSLHSTLSSRIATHERLLALNGRLELVLSQIEARAAYVEQAAARNGRVPQVQGVKFDQQRSAVAQRTDKAVVDERARREGKKWVEESDDEDDGKGVSVDQSGVVVRGDEDEDSDVEIQDITLGAEEEDDEEEEDDDDDEDEVVVRRRKPRARLTASEGNTSAESGSEDEEDLEEMSEDEDEDEGDEDEDDDEEDEEEDEDDDEEDESDLEGEGASDLEDEEEDEDDSEDGHGPNGMFDLEAEEGTDEDDED